VPRCWPGAVRSQQERERGSSRGIKLLGTHGVDLGRFRSSRTYVLDTKPDPLSPQVVRTIERPRSSPPRPATPGRTRPLRAGRHLHVQPGGADGNGPGGVALIDHDTFEVIGRWEAERGDRYFAYYVWWHLKDDVAVTSEWATRR
jgi:selenium-binding protein 1